MIKALSVLVNHQCNMHCGHCGYARFLPRSGSPILTPEDWREVIVRACTELRSLEVVAIAGMEPLLPGAIQSTVAVLETAFKQGKRSGLVTNGTHAELLSQQFPDFWCSYIDLSVDTWHEQAWKSSAPYWTRMERLLRGKVLSRHTGQLSISTVVSRETLPALPRLLEWALRVMPVPRIGILPLRPTSSNPNAEPLSDDEVRHMLHLLAEYRPRFEFMALEIIAGSVAGLQTLMREGLLPEGSVGSGWGYAQGGVPLSYAWLAGLTEDTARISPEGFVPLHLGALETEQYLDAQPVAGNVRTDSWVRIEQALAGEATRLKKDTPPECRGRVCENVCHGSNERCPILVARDRT